MIRVLIRFPGDGERRLMSGDPGYQFVSESQRQVMFAGFIMRAIAYIIDGIFITLIALIIGMSAGLATGMSNMEILDLAYIVSGLVSLVYTIGFWAELGGTPGKIILGMRIVGPDGSLGGIGWGRALLRMLGYVVSTIPCYLGFIWVALDKDSQGWHDKIARTYVVNV
jgi:uncharacterized RDD family membrane protein YckC